jgi:hypothetical protein
MRKAALLLLVAATIPVGLVAEEAPGPPSVLVINREEIKPGKMEPHEKVAARFVAVLNKANAHSFRLGLVPVSGDDNQVVYLEGYQSFAELEASRNQLEAAAATNAAIKAELDQIAALGDQHASQKTGIAVLRKDLSYQPKGMDAVAQSRYMSISRTSVKPGRIPDYVDWVKELNAARDKAKADWVHTAVYQVISGAPVGTFLTFTLTRSLTEWDEFGARMDERNKAIDAALGGDEVVKRRRQQISEIVAETVPTLYAMKPSISRPTEQFVAYDPGFWKPQPAAAGAKLATKKEPKN